LQVLITWSTLSEKYFHDFWISLCIKAKTWIFSLWNFQKITTPSCKAHQKTVIPQFLWKSQITFSIKFKFCSKWPKFAFFFKLFQKFKFLTNFSSIDTMEQFAWNRFTRIKTIRVWICLNIDTKTLNFVSFHYNVSFVSFHPLCFIRAYASRFQETEFRNSCLKVELWADTHLDFISIFDGPYHGMINVQVLQ
jgi:hypothetical protein